MSITKGKKIVSELKKNEIDSLVDELNDNMTESLVDELKDNMTESLVDELNDNKADVYPDLEDENGLVYSEIYAKRIKELCDKKGLSINQLAEMSGVKQTTIDNIIHGVSKNPTTKTIHLIATALGMKFSEFVEYSEVNEYPLDKESYVKKKDSRKLKK